MDNYLARNIKVKDNREKLVDISKYVDVIIKKENIGKIKIKNRFVRKSVALMLKKASLSLPRNCRLIIYDGYRSLKIQTIFFERQLKSLRKRYPSWNLKKLKKEASKYVADPEGICPHKTGGAVDVSISCNGREIDFGGFNLFKEKKISLERRMNRKFLARIMEKAGFVNYPLEWWHWSYGDMYWAAVKKKKFSIYSEIK